MKSLNIGPGLTGIIGSLLLLSSLNMYAQQAVPKRISIGEALAATKNNLQYEVNNLELSKSRLVVKTSGALPKTGVFAENEDMRPGDNKGILKIGFSQSIAWPGLYKAQQNLYTEQGKYYQVNTALIDADLKRNVRTVYYQLWYLQDKHKLFSRLDSLYRSLCEAARLKVKTGDSPGLDSIAANVRAKEVQALLQQINKDIRIQQQMLMQLFNTGESIMPVEGPLEKLILAENPVDSVHPVLSLQTQLINIANAGVAVTKNENRPDFSGRFFSQRLYGLSDPFTGFSVSAAIPLFGAGAYRNKVKAARAEVQVRQKKYEYDRQVLHTQRVQVQMEVEKNNSLLSFYETSGLKQADEIIKAASLAYRAGEISFSELSQFLSQAIDIQRNYLENLNAYNQSVIQYYYFINQ